jgi:hypothetical protein
MPESKMTKLPLPFEHRDNEKLAKLIAYIPAMLHVQTMIKLGTEEGLEAGKSKENYNQAIEFAADQFLFAAINDSTELDLPFTFE